MADEEDQPEETVDETTFQPTVAFVRSDELNLIAAALVIAQKKLKNPDKNAVNPHFKNRYADLGASMEAAKDAFNAADISIVQTFAPAPYGTVGVTTLAIHKSGQYIGGTVHVPLDRANAQGLGSAATYARRYGVQAITGMVAEDDDDGAAASTGDGDTRPQPSRKPSGPRKGLFGK